MANVISEAVALNRAIQTAEGILHSILDDAVDSLDRSGDARPKAMAPQLHELVSEDIGPTDIEACDAATNIGFSPHRFVSFRTAPGLATSLAASLQNSNSVARAACLPIDKLWQTAATHVACSARSPERCLRLSRWLRTAFLLNGRRFVPDLHTPNMLWSLVAIELEGAVWSSLPGACDLRQFALSQLGDQTSLGFVEQLVCCELARAELGEQAFSSDTPLRYMPLGGAVRYGVHDVSLPADLVPLDFQPYFQPPLEVTA